MRRRVVVAVVLVVALAACAPPGLSSLRNGVVENLTGRDLIVEPVGVDEPRRKAVRPKAAYLWSSSDACLGTGVAVFAASGEHLATLDRRICDGEQLVITPDDLR